MLIGVISEGETPSADQLQDGLDSLSDMLGSWSTEGLVVPNIVREEFSLVPGQAAYTMGPTGNFDTTRPVKIEFAKIADQGSSPATEMPVEILSVEQYADIPQKAMQSTYPQQLFVSGTSPLETLTLWPVPSAAHKIVLYSRKILISIANANTELSLPPGYAKAIRFNLAIEIAPEYSKAVSAEVAKGASDSKANVERVNIRPEYMKCDEVFLGSSRGFNILTGE